MNYNREITITRDDLLPLMYFIVSIYQQGKTHRQGISAKSDLIGGYIDRWINKLPENIIFNKILCADKNYKVINDYFIYGTELKSDKNAPDILGLKTKNGIIKFAEFEDNTWNNCGGMPHIEVKTSKTNQKLVAVRETQLYDSNYYVFVESNFANDYLLSFFVEDYFNDEVLKSINMDTSFIKSNRNKIISQPIRIKPLDNENIGSLKLLTIMNGLEFRENATKVNAKENIYYFNNIEEVDKVYRENKDIILRDYINSYGHVHFGKKIIPIETDKFDKIKIKSIFKSSIYIEALDNCCIYNEDIYKGKIYKIGIGEFERNSNNIEYIMLKKQFSKGLDKTQELIELLDTIANK